MKKEDEKIDRDIEEIIESIEIEEKPKRKRKSKKKTEKVEEQVDYCQFLLVPIDFVLDKLSKRFNDQKFLLNQDERIKLGTALNKVSNKYLPTILGKYGEELELIIISFFIFYPRYSLYKEYLSKEKESQKSEKQNE